MIRVTEQLPEDHALRAEQHVSELTGYISLESISSWSELLGIDDPVEIVEAMTHVRDHGEPEPDPTTGENVWTDSFTLLRHREQSREREAIKAQEEGTRDDPRSPLLRSTMAAYNAVHQPVGGGECAMDRCRRAARERLGMTKEPSKKPKATSRLMTSTTAMSAHEGEGDAEDYAKALAPHQDVIELSRRQFLHDLTGSNVSPLQDTTPLEVENTAEERDPFAATMRKYGG